MSSDYYLPHCRTLTRIVFLLSDLVGVFLWSMGDAIIVSSSIILNHYFECLHHHMTSRRNNCTEADVEEYSAVYLLIAELVNEVNTVFSPLILLTIGSNLIFIMTTFYCGLESSTTNLLLNRVAFHVTCVCIVLKLAASTFFAARLSERVGTNVINHHQLPALN